jgi:hypothetical protein
MIMKFLSHPTLLFLLAGAISVSAESTITSWTIDSGGGRSTGGVYAVTGSLGQPSGGIQRSASFQLAGGYVGLVAVVSTEGAPLLRLEQSPREVILAWPVTAPGFRLEQTPSLARRGRRSGTLVPQVGMRAAR